MVDEKQQLNRRQDRDRGCPPRHFPPLDFLLLFLLVFANLPAESNLEFGKMMIDLSQTGEWWGAFFEKSLVENPIASGQAALAVALLILYGMVSFGVIGRGARRNRVIRQLLLGAFVALFVFLPALGEIALRFEAGPKGHAHDGGVIQTEEALKFFLAGTDPYGADYRSTPMATLEWGRGNPAIIHHPYFPLSFLVHAPFYSAGKWVAGAYDARLLYLILFLVPFPLVVRWTKSREKGLALAALWGLNPFLVPHLVQGRNDVVVLTALIVAMHFVIRKKWTTAAILFGAACSTKQFALLLAPFLLLLAGHPASSWVEILRRGARRLWPTLIPLAMFVLPFVLWDPAAFFDDTVAFNTGASEVSYPLGGTPGYGGANWVNIFGLAESRYHYFPFWFFQLVVVLPALALLLRWQKKENTPSRAVAAFSLFLMVFLYCSRIFHINYLGPVFFLVAVAVLADRFGSVENKSGGETTAEQTDSDEALTAKREADREGRGPTG